MMPSLTPLEIPVFSPNSARQAESLGARRVELNARGSYPAGGLTPSLHDLQAVSSSINIPNRVMIRPRGPPGSGMEFIYTDLEFETMIDAIRMFVKEGNLEAEKGDGFVFGILELDSDGRPQVDKERNRQLVDAAAGFKCTFHRAFDELVASRNDTASESHANGIAKAIGDVTECGFDAVLTSGGPGKAEDHVDGLRRILEGSRGKFRVIVGGGVRSGNVRRILDDMGVTKDDDVWGHSSCLASGSGEELDEAETQGIVAQM